jgi:hypothetical protein
MMFSCYAGDDVKGGLVQVFVGVQEAPGEFKVVVLLLRHLIATAGQEHLQRFAVEPKYNAVNRDVRVEVQSILIHVNRCIEIR